MDSNDLHPSWYDHMPGSAGLLANGHSTTISKHMVTLSSEDEDDTLLKELNQALEDEDEKIEENEESEKNAAEDLISSTAPTGNSKKIAFLFDSYLTGCLMMGNLSPVRSEFFFLLFF